MEMLISRTKGNDFDNIRRLIKKSVSEIDSDIREKKTWWLLDGRGDGGEGKGIGKHKLAVTV